MKSIRCGRGLGDSIYLQSVARHLIETRRLGLIVRTDYPEVFLPLRVKTAPFERRADITAHYVGRKGFVGTTQFQDCCIAAGIHEPVDLRIDWVIQNQALADAVRGALVVQLPRRPMARLDGFGASLLPDCAAIQRGINAARDHGYRIVQVGAGEPLYRFSGIDLDLANRTSIAELIDVACVASRCLGYVSYMVPLAESFSKPALFVWSARGLLDQHPFIRRITPQKVIHKKTSQAVFDNVPESQLLEAIDAFLRA